MNVIQSFFKINASPRLIACFFIVLAVFSWIDPFAFFKSDDWIFIARYAEKKSFTDFIWVPHGGQHVIPLFKCLYYGELLLFGKNAICFQLLSIISWGLLTFVFYRVLGIIQPENRKIAFFISLTLCLHPDFGDIIYWIFQQGVIIHMLFQAISILFYFRYLRENHRRDLAMFTCSLFLQNYFFGNGILFPALFIIHFIAERKKLASQTLLILVLLQVLFIFVQKSLSVHAIDFTMIFENAGAIFQSFFRLIYVAITRFFFIRNFGGLALGAFAVLLFSIQSYLAFRNNKKLFFFAVMYLGLSTFSIAVARSQVAFFAEKQIHYYYSVLLFPAMFFMLFLALSELRSKRQMKTAGFFFALYICGFAAINVQTKRIYSYKNFKNKEAINNATHYAKKNYYPFDDPMYSNSRNLYIDNMLNPVVQRSIQKNNYFGADSSIVDYLGKSNFDNFIRHNREMITSYKYLEENSLFDLDINYEKQ